MNNQLSEQQTKRIEQEAEARYPSKRRNMGDVQSAYISGATAKALRNIELEKENERLRELIKTAWYSNAYGVRTGFTNTGQYDQAWAEFKTENNL